MPTVKAYDVIACKYRLVCNRHEEQEVKITRIWLQTSLTKLHSTRVIMWVQALHWLPVLSVQAHTSKGNALHSCTLPLASHRKISNVIQDYVIQPQCPELFPSSSFCCHKCRRTPLHTVLINAIIWSSVWNLVTRKCILMKRTC